MTSDDTTEAQQEDIAAGQLESPAALSDSSVVEAQVANGEKSDETAAEDLADANRRILDQLGKTIIGQEEVLEQLLLSLFVGGNSIVTGVPGLAKTMMVQALSEIVQLNFNRIQFTPDLMPSDITGTDIIQEDPETHQRKMIFMPGPIFAQIVLADEINRTPPKTQAALLEAMQEQRITVQGRTYELDKPFFVFATQNPIELEGTYPLPEAQLDRFMFNIIVEHLDEVGEMRVVESTTSNEKQEIQPQLGAEELRSFHRLVRRVPVAESVLRSAVQLVRMTRPDHPEAPDYVRTYVQYGASVRAAQFLVLGGKARALTRGRFHVNHEDLAAIARPILRHRILANFQADSEKVTTDDLISRLLESLPRETSGLS